MKPGKRIKKFFLVRPPDWIRKFSSGVVWRIATKEPVLFLTFDDGPVPGSTEWILTELDHWGAKATFFCVGENVEKRPDLYRMILDRGHSVGNHTFSHLNGYRTGLRRYVRDTYRAEKLIDSRLFRPPYGRIRPRVSRLLRPGFRIVLWDVLSMDYDGELEPDSVLDNVLTEARPGSIIVFHDHVKAGKNLKYVLPRVLEHYSKAGYRFLPITENLLKNKLLGHEPHFS